jgi:hypothetical protein
MRNISFLRNGRKFYPRLVLDKMPTVSHKKDIFSSILDTIETTVVQFKKINRRMYQKRAIMFGYVQMSNGKILGEKYNRLGHRAPTLAKRFNINYE